VSSGVEFIVDTHVTLTTMSLRKDAQQAKGQFH